MKLNTVNDDKSYVQLDLAFAGYKAEDKSRILTLGLKLTLGLESEKCHCQRLIMKLNTVNDDKSYVQLDLAFAGYKAEDKSRTLTLTLGLKLTLGLESEKCHFQ